MPQWEAACNEHHEGSRQYLTAFCAGNPLNGSLVAQSRVLPPSLVQVIQGQIPTGASRTCSIGVIWPALVGVIALTAKTVRKIRINLQRDMKK